MPIKGVGWSEHCRSCVGYGWGEKLAVPEGSGSTGVMLWGEALGAEEERDQLPFRPHAQAGSLLERAIRMAGFTRSQFTLTNSVMCRPPANKLDGQPYERAAVESCHHYNDRLMKGRQPRVILALGAVPTRALTDFDGSTRQRSISMVRGWVAPSRAYTDQAEVLVPGYANHDPLLVLPTLHPSYIQRGAKEFLAVLVHDIRLAVHMARQGIGSPAPVQYQLAPSVSDALSFLEQVRSNRQSLLSYDIETPWSKDHDEDDNPESEGASINSIQFSLGAYRGIAFPWAGRYIEIARDILAEANPKLGANSWQYDEPRLAVHDVQVRGVHHDLRWAFHCLYPDLPSNLQFVCSFLSTRMRLLTQNSYDRDAAAERAWKHTAQVEGSDYGCRDVDMPHRAWPLLVDELHRVGAWRSYAEHTLRVRPILVRASEYGIPVSRPMHHAFETRLQTELSAKMAELQGIVPDDLKGVQPPGGYKNPKLAEKRMALPNQGLAEGERWIEMEFTNDSRRGKDRGRDSVGSSEVGAGSLHGDGDSAIGSDCVEDGGDGQARHEAGARTVTRWARLQPFLPDSPQQVVKLIRSLGDRVPKQDDGEGDTTGKAGLERLARQTKRPVYRLILECRALSEMKGTHVEGWRPSTYDDDTGRVLSEGTERAESGGQVDGTWGRVHPSFTFTPSTGQLACYGSPNALNPPKPKGQAEKDRLAVSFRQMIEARPGYRLWELDLKSAHALTLGFEADCPEYMRLARLDIHSYVAAHLERVPDVRDCLAWPDDQLALFLADVKRRYKATRDDRAKPCIAEGQLVLTDKGLVPIENISLEHRLWDGVEWVKHSGLIDSGIQEVITHDGFTGTPGHLVLTGDGRAVPLVQAASEMARIATTGDEGKAIRTRYRSFLESEACQWLHQTALRMQHLSPEEVDRQVEPYVRPEQGMSTLFAEVLRRQSQAISSKVRRYLWSLQQTVRSCLQTVWRPWYSLSIPLPQGICVLGGPESASPFLSQTGDRSDPQRWPLRAGEPALSYAFRTAIEPPEYGMAAVSGTTYSAERFPESLRLQLDASACSPGYDRRGHHSARTGTRDKRAVKNVERLAPVARFARVFDIANAGPRRCFTVSNKLVFNSILGLGFGMGYRKLYSMNRESFAGEADARRVRDMLRSLFPRVFEWQDEVRALAHRQGFLLSRHGAIRWFQDVYHHDWRRGQVVPGEDSEAAIAFLPANDAFGYLKDAMLMLDDQCGGPCEGACNTLFGGQSPCNTDGWLAECGLMIPFHDALVFEMPRSLEDDAIPRIYQAMTAPSPVLDGLWIGASVSCGSDWASMEELNEEEFLGK